MDDTSKYTFDMRDIDFPNDGKEITQYSHIYCMSVNSPTERVYITRQQIQSLLNHQGGYREKRLPVAYMTVELLDNGTRCNMIKCFAADNSYICAIAFNEKWIICS